MTLCTHPEATADPQTIRWAVPPGTLPFLGEAEVPTQLRQSGIVKAVVGSTYVDLTAAPDLDWWRCGTRVRTALLDDLADPGRWRPCAGQSAGSGLTAGSVLTAVMQEVIAGPPGDVIRSHGGQVSLVEVRDGVAVVELAGACRHCPAVRMTLHSTLERAVRRRYPDLVGIELAGRDWAPRPGD